MFNMRQARGSGIINQFRIETYLGLAAFAVILFPDFNKMYLPIIGVLYFICTYTLGHVDEKYLGFWQAEREKNMLHANPARQRLERHMIRIQKHLDIDMEGDDEVEYTGTKYSR